MTDVYKATGYGIAHGTMDDAGVTWDNPAETCEHSTAPVCTACAMFEDCPSARVMETTRKEA